MKATDKWLECGQAGQVRYRVVRLAKPRGRVLVLPGFGEAIEKYEAATQHLSANRLESLVIDWPGQGLSRQGLSRQGLSRQGLSRQGLSRQGLSRQGLSRQGLSQEGLSDEKSAKYPTLVHSRGFDGHLEAITRAAKREGFMDGAMPLFVLGHSMGGHLALRLLAGLSTRLSKDAALRGVIIVAPMIMPPVFKFLPAPLIVLIARVFCLLGLGRFPIKGSEYEGRPVRFNPDNPLTRCPDGYAVQLNCWQSNPASKSTTPSWGWLHTAYASCRTTTANASWMKALGIKSLGMKSLDCPIQAHIAEDERIVSAAHTSRYLPLIAGIELHSYKDARHELLMELPEVRDSIWQRIDTFIARNLPQ